MSDFLALIIEDDAAISAIYAESLEMAGYETEIIDNGRSAIKRIQEIIPALILLDLHLPEIFGEDVLKAIKNEPKLAKTRIFIATADHIRAEDLRDDVDLILLKPISFMQLRDMALRFRPAK
ncbi:MAG: response regulator [Anaerolineae bacterium]|nr:response regulator [Anaerolineae bacterium]